MLPVGWFVDWLSVSQDHASCPLLGSDYVIHTDPDTGAVTREHVIGVQHEGSHDTNIRIRSDGFRVEISGNPSRFARADNLFGYRSVDECMAFYNRILDSIGLPRFTLGDAFDRAATGTCQIVGGARISRVDLSYNYAANCESDAQLVLRGLSACGRRGQRWQVGTGGMVYSGSRAYARAKYYDKSSEMNAHGNSVALRRCAYRERVRQYCADNGVIRFEVELGRKLLQRQKLNGWCLWSDERGAEIAAKYDRMNELGVTVNQFDQIADRLIALGHTPTQATKAQHAAYAWLAGVDLRATMERNPFYRTTKLLQDVGIDARVPCDISAVTVRPRVVDVRPAEIPDWYEMPRVA